MSYDRPAKEDGQKKMGIFKDDPTNNNPLGLKDSINIPDWVTKQKSK